jgi:hypothetical protein
MERHLQARQSMRRRVSQCLLVCAFSASACQSPPAPARQAPGGKPAAAQATAPKPAAAPTGDQWVPAEFRDEDNQWRDVGVYVDGQPVGFLWIGELPRSLQPVWEEYTRVMASRNRVPIRTKKIRRPLYRLADYLEAVGIDLRTVKQVYVHGGRIYASGISGKNLLRQRDKLLFRFSQDDHGKPLPVFLPGLKVNAAFDNMRAISVFIHKKPPRLLRDHTLELNGEPVTDVPYHGKPLRGGIHFYKDGRLATVFKRNRTDDVNTIGRETLDGERSFRLFDFLEARGTSTADITEAELVHDDIKIGTLDRKALSELVFSSSSQARGAILIGKDRRPVQAILLYTSRLSAHQPEKPGSSRN